MCPFPCFRATLKVNEDMDDRWMRQFIRQRYVWRTTWKLRIGMLLLVAAIVVPTRTCWLTWLGRSLVHDDVPTSSDAIVLENYDPNYLVFETAGRLMREGLSDSLLVPVHVLRDAGTPTVVSLGVGDVMTRGARITSDAIIPGQCEEPITLTVATEVAKRLQHGGARSEIVVSSTFRSQRSFEVYRSVLGPLGIRICCVTAGGSRTAENWWKSKHGIQMVCLEFIKLQYYRRVVFGRL